MGRSKLRVLVVLCLQRLATYTGPLMQIHRVDFKRLRKRDDCSRFLVSDGAGPHCRAINSSEERSNSSAFGIVVGINTSHLSC